MRKSTTTKLSFARARSSLCQKYPRCKKKKKSEVSEMSTCFLGDYVTFQLSCCFFFTRCTFKAFHILPGEFLTSKGIISGSRSHTLMNFQHLEEKKNRSAFLARIWGNQARLSQESESGSWETISECIFFFTLSLSLFCRHDDLKEMLDSNKDSLKLEAMKRIVAVSTDNVRAGMQQNVASRGFDFQVFCQIHLCVNHWYLVLTCRLVSKQKSKCEKGCNRSFVALRKPFNLQLADCVFVCFVCRWSPEAKMLRISSLPWWRTWPVRTSRCVTSFTLLNFT